MNIQVVPKNAATFKFVWMDEYKKWWLAVDFELDGKIYEWFPRQEHQHLLAKGIALCEDFSYPPSHGRKGRVYAACFLLDSMMPEVTFDELFEKYNFGRNASNGGLQIEGDMPKVDTFTKKETLLLIKEHIDKELDEILRKDDPEAYVRKIQDKIQNERTNT